MNNNNFLGVYFDTISNNNKTQVFSPLDIELAFPDIDL
jgi:hypothetical protein